MARLPGDFGGFPMSDGAPRQFQAHCNPASIEFLPVRFIAPELVLDDQKEGFQHSARRDKPPTEPFPEWRFVGPFLQIFIAAQGSRYCASR